jgi:peptide-methionine (S)-S-oxide reductase
MTARSLTAILGIAVALGLAGAATARAQDAAKAPADADKADATKPKAEKAATPKGKKADAPKPKAEKADAAKPKLEKATLGGGCFWCMEAVFERIKGVKSVVSGYAGGTVPRPSYEMVQTGTTGHAEVVQIEFDPEVVTFEELLEVFWHAHDPTSYHRQGPDEGPEYRSIILFHNQEQQRAAQKSYLKVSASGLYARPIVTELVPLTKFYPAERYHQDYFRKNPGDAYCQINIVPKLMKLRAEFQNAPAQPRNPSPSTKPREGRSSRAGGASPP